ncbi:MAG TPA: C-terminal helicase domain-containing protein, partial [Microlunatus sp.]|nr:C-terminal helicase domain-containing protein [Microlunatus sp.]
MTVPATAQFVYQVHDLDKPEIVARILQAENRNRVMIFCRTKRAAQRLADDLVERGFSASAIHGDLSQVLREKALKRFRAGGVDVLVATDVAARGIDVDGVTHVINYECTDDDKTYVHRIGRTGRAGASGVAITFVDWADMTRWKVINNTLGLPFPEPQETYSTSEHLFHDQGIDRTVTGRLVPLPTREPSARSGRGDRSSRSDANGAGRSELSPEEEAAQDAEREQRRKDRPKRDRNRRRLRNGQPVEASGETTEAVSAETTTISAPAAQVDGDTAGTTPGVEGDAPKRRRRRRRGGSGRSGESADAGGDSGSDGGASSSDAAASA